MKIERTERQNKMSVQRKKDWRQQKSQIDDEEYKSKMATDKENSD